MSEQQPVIGIVMGSNSDWPTMKAAAQVLKDFGVPFEAPGGLGAPHARC
jgi:5-(carboxyamino)imidazole ribonucleotide mutase